jgi:hypothetical protein
MVSSTMYSGLFGIKVMRMIFFYTSLIIAKNYMSQIYMEKVLVNDENPPKLSNFIYLALIVEAIFMVLFLGLLYVADIQFNLKLSSNNFFTEYVIPDFIIASVFISLYGGIVANKMTNKKFFLYKEDGLRAIRALSEVMLSISFVTNVIPWNMLTVGLYSTIISMSNKMKSIGKMV